MHRCLSCSDADNPYWVCLKENENRNAESTSVLKVSSCCLIYRKKGIIACTLCFQIIVLGGSRWLTRGHIFKYSHEDSDPPSTSVLMYYCCTFFNVCHYYGAGNDKKLYYNPSESECLSQPLESYIQNLSVIFVFNKRECLLY